MFVFLPTAAKLTSFHLNLFGVDDKLFFLKRMFYFWWLLFQRMKNIQYNDNGQPIGMCIRISRKFIWLIGTGENWGNEDNWVRGHVNWVRGHDIHENWVRGHGVYNWVRYHENWVRGHDICNNWVRGHGVYNWVRDHGNWVRGHRIPEVMRFIEW